MRSKWQKWRKEALSCPVVITMHVFYWRWMLGEFAASVWTAQIRFTLETEKKGDPVGFPTHAWVTLNWVERLFCVVAPVEKLYSFESNLCFAKKKTLGEAQRPPWTAGRVFHKQSHVPQLVQIYRIRSPFLCRCRKKLLLVIEQSA